MYDTLTEWDFETLKPKPGLAESWNFTDPTTLVFNIRPGINFHDGTPLDAEAVKFNLERSKSDQKSNIKADLASLGVRRGHRSAAGHAEIERAGRRAAGDPFRPRRHDGLTDSVKAAASGTVTRKPVGAGAYTFVSWADGENIVVKRNEKYWKPDRPYLDGIEFSIIPELTTGARSVTPDRTI